MDDDSRSPPPPMFVIKLPLKAHQDRLLEMQSSFIHDFYNAAGLNKCLPVIQPPGSHNGTKSYCGVCQETLGTKNKNIVRHIFSERHCANLVRHAGDVVDDAMHKRICGIVDYCYFKCLVCEHWIASRNDAVNGHLVEHSPHELAIHFERPIYFLGVKCDLVPRRETQNSRRAFLAPYHPRDREASGYLTQPSATIQGASTSQHKGDIFFSSFSIAHALGN